MQIKIKKGLNVPIEGKPETFKGEITSAGLTALDIQSLPLQRLKPLKKEGESVLKGEPLLEDKDVLGRVCISPTSGKVKEIKRGLKRSITTVVIEKESEEHYQYESFDISSKEKILTFLNSTGLLMGIQMRPFGLIARADTPPKKIFVRAIESYPFAVPCSLQVEGYEKAFQQGLSLLSELVDGNIHLVMDENEEATAFTGAIDVNKHTFSGPHPSGLSSVHIHHIDPIVSVDDIAWTLGVVEVLAIGHLLEEKIHYLKRVCSIGGSVNPEKIGYYKVDAGISIKELLNEEIDQNTRLISGNPLFGHPVSIDDYLGFFDTTLSVLRHEEKRKFLHFLRFFRKEYTATRAYASFLSNKRPVSFTDKKHGELRAFINSEMYDKVMPMNIPTVLLIKSLIAEDYETAVKLGLLEVVPEDFALASFVCPSKIEMVSIVEQKLDQFYKMQ